MRIGEIAKAAGISEYTLRYYEKKGLIRVRRDNVGRRCYDESDVEWIKFIKRLKDTGMLLKDITEYSRLRYEGNTTMPKRLEMLEKVPLETVKLLKTTIITAIVSGAVGAILSAVMSAT